MTRPKASRRQLSLFEADQAELPFDAVSPPEPRPRASREEQLLLFSGKVPLVGEVESALLSADFGAAKVAFDQLRATYPTEPSVPTYEFVLEIPTDLWEPSHSNASRCDVWATIARRFTPDSEAYLQARDGYFRRFLGVADAREVVLGHPLVAPDVANYLVDIGEWRTGRELVRDLLVAGNELSPLAFHDEAVRELLGEEGHPTWLACLGAIRRLWPREPLDVSDLVSIETRMKANLPDEDEQKALDFWYCLSVSGLGARVPQRLRRDAHRRMKLLHAEFHEEYMTGRRARTG